MAKKQPPLTYKIGETQTFKLAIAELRRSNKNFRRVIDNVLVTEDEYQDWLARRLS